LGVHKDSEFKSIQDVITFAKANPGKLGIAGNKIGSLHHKLIVDFFNAAGAEVNYIPYEGSGDAVKDVLGKHVAMGLGTIGQWQPHVEAGTVRPLVVINEERVPSMAEVPTPKELGFNYPILHQWQGLFALKGTPPDVRRAVADAMKKVIDSEEYKTYLQRSPHVIAAFEADQAKLKKDFDYELGEFKAFLSKNGLI
jgi:tripartite-type tricarboxylate transporter receptor subunit TctC